MRLYRCFAWNRRAKPDEPDGPLWFPRSLQGEGRHDNPDLYGCLYLSEREMSSVVEQLARFRSQRLTPSLLRRRGLPLAIARLDLKDPAGLIDLDDPAVLLRVEPAQLTGCQADPGLCVKLDDGWRRTPGVSDPRHHLYCGVRRHPDLHRTARGPFLEHREVVLDQQPKFRRSGFSGAKSRVGSLQVRPICGL